MVRLERKGTAAWIVLDRPEVRNALSAALMKEAADALARSLGDPAVRSIVVTGEGDAFSAGADLREMKAMNAAPYRENVDNALTLSNLFYAIAAAPKPVVARVNGPAVAGALGIVSACDVAIAVEGVKFAFTEARLGIVPAMISPFVVRRIGAAHARRLFLTGESFTAEEAERIGLVDRVVAREALDETVAAVCRDLARSAPGALAEVKTLIARVAEGSPDTHRAYTAEIIARLRAGEEGQEGMAAFLEKRKPRWVVE
ncbi:MAG: enoyl-CoA hydratase-related protein [Candidatus Binatia bacterium]